MTLFKPHLQVLPPSQAQLWPELSCIPQHFALYGGTAIALRLGHRTSVDFDFFSSRSFHPDELIETVPFLSRGERLQSKPNTLTVTVTPGAPIILSFFGGLSLGRVGEPNQAEGNQVIVASLLDLAATKMAVIQQRAEKKDYVDITRLIQAGVALETALGAAIALYGENFNPAISLKALAYFADGDLPKLSEADQRLLAKKAASVREIPAVPRISDSISFL